MYRKCLALLLAVMLLACGTALAEKDKSEPAPAYLSTAACLKAMDEQGLIYSLEEVISGLETVTVHFTDDTSAGLPDFDVLFIFEADNMHMGVRIYDLKTVPAEKRAAVLEACNTLNDRYKYLCFYVDEYNELSVKLDFVVPTLSDVGTVCIEMLIRTVSITQDGWATLAAALA